jgi:hypothetical protein
MARKNVPGWLSWAALLAAAVVVPACNANGGGGGAAGNPNLLWKSQSGGGGPAAPAGLVWRDVNLGPISGGGGLGGDMTFETAGEIDITNGVATVNPFKGDLNPVSVSLAQDSTQEGLLQGDITGWYQLYVSKQGLPGGGGGGVGGLGGGGFNVNLAPFLGIGDGIVLECRADCENCAIQGKLPGGLKEDPIAPNSLTWRLIKCGVNPNLMNPYGHNAGGGPLISATDTTAFSTMQGAGLTTRLTSIQGSGYFGTGYWTLNGNNYWAAVVIDLPLGQSP